MNRPRVVVTGMGGLCCLGGNAAEIWQAMRAGRCGIGHFDIPHMDELKTKLGGQILELPEHDFDKRKAMSLSRFGLLSALATREALRHARLDAAEHPDLRIGAVIGVGVYGGDAVEKGYRDLFLEGRHRADVLSVPRAMPSSAAAHASMLFGLRGPVFGVTSACSSANQALASALDLLRAGRADAVVAGGTDAPLVYGVMKGWEAMRVVAKTACRPFSADREGLIVGEGAASFVLETLEGAQRRGAPSWPSSPAPASPPTRPTSFRRRWRDRSPRSAIVSPMPDCHRAMSTTSTPTEPGRSPTTAPRPWRSAPCSAVMPNSLSVSSTKSMHAHCLGASGALEAIACVMAIREGVVPPTVNYTTPDPECDLDVTPNVARQRPVSVALSNSFAFGGANATLAFKAV